MLGKCVPLWLDLWAGASTTAGVKSTAHATAEVELVSVRWATRASTAANAGLVTSKLAACATQRNCVQATAEGTGLVITRSESASVTAVIGAKIARNSIANDSTLCAIGARIQPAPPARSDFSQCV